MNREQVISFVDSLSKGLHPVTGARMPEELSGAPEVTEALETAAALLRASATRPAAAGARWTDDEDVRLCREFDSGVPIPEIAREHGRTSGAITSRLVRLGRIDPDSVKTRERGARLAPEGLARGRSASDGAPASLSAASLSASEFERSEFERQRV